MSIQLIYPDGNNLLSFTSHACLSSWRKGGSYWKKDVIVMLTPHPSLTQSEVSAYLELIEEISPQVLPHLKKFFNKEYMVFFKRHSHEWKDTLWHLSPLRYLVEEVDLVRAILSWKKRGNVSSISAFLLGHNRDAENNAIYVSYIGHINFPTKWTNINPSKFLEEIYTMLNNDGESLSHNFSEIQVTFDEFKDLVVKEFG